MRTRAAGLGGVALLAVSLACAGHRAREADRAHQAGTVQVERVRASVDQTTSGQVWVTIEGSLPDACTRLDRIQRRRFGSRIELTLTTRRPAGSQCPPETQPFEKAYTFHVADYPPGSYILVANGVETRLFIHTGLRPTNPLGSPFEP